MQQYGKFNERAHGNFFVFQRSSFFILSGHPAVCVECLIGKQKKPIFFKVTEPSP